MSDVVKAGATGMPALAGLNPDADFDVSNVILPILTLRQNTYKNEAVKKFHAGDIILRPDMRVVASEDKVFQVIPLSISMFTKVLEEVTSSETRLVRTEEVDPSKPYTFTEGGRNMRRDICYMVYFLPVDAAKLQVAAMTKGTFDADDFVLPLRVTFTRGGLYAGKVVASHFETCKLFNSPPFNKVFDLRSETKTNDKGNWFVYNMTPALEKDKNMKTPVDILPIASFWAKTLAKSANVIRVAPEEDVVEIGEIHPELPTNF
jgi:hypothetical protein